MNKTQEFVQNKCIMSAHPECKSLEAALKKELHFGCDIFDKLHNKKAKLLYVLRNDHLEVFDGVYNYSLVEWEYKIMGMPCTLPRILNALQKNYDEQDSGYKVGFWDGYVIEYLDRDYKSSICKWEVLNSTGCEVLFKNQTKETRQAIANLLNTYRNKKEVLCT